MKFAIIGYGKMGHEIERVIIARGGEVVLKIDHDNKGDLTTQNLQKADVAIEFSTPQTAFDNIAVCIESGTPIVSGTTGWIDRKPQIEALCTRNNGKFFWSSNFSIGVNLFFRINEQLAAMMNRAEDYDVTIEEIHHIQKKDAPSGTAITLAQGVLGGVDRKNKWVLGPTIEPDELGVAALRRSTVAGTHNVTWESDVDKIELIHTAKSRAGFAVGAVVAAEFLVGQNPGIYTMNDLL